MAGYIGRQQSQILTNVGSDTVETGDIQDGAVTAAKLDTTYATPAYVDAAESDAVSTANAYTDTAIVGVSSDLVDDTTPQLGGDLDTNGYNVNFTDNVKAQFGAGNDLQISHNGSHSIIQDVGTGNLYVSGTELALVNGDFSQTYALFNSGGGSNLYYNNSPKLATTSTGVSVTGRVVASEDIRLANTSTWTGEHNGKLQVLNGNLYIQGGASSNNIIFRNASGTNIVQFKENGDVQFNSGYGSAATAYGCRAWVNFNGTGSVAIRDSGNVSSITDNGTGDYTLNFSTAMVDANYAPTAMGRTWPGVQSEGFVIAFANYSSDGSSQRTTTSLRIVSLNQVTNRTDSPSVHVAIFR